MLFLNIHPIWDNNRPVPPSIIYTGGLHQEPQKKLPTDLSSFLDSSRNGVIYFSLEHPKIKLFITQGGLQSTDEAITSGVPLIGIPMLGDQWFNTEKYVHHEIGMKLDLETITEENLRTAIENVISTKKYRENILRLRSLMHDQPLSSLERAVWWTEHVLRHGQAEHLQTPAKSSSISWVEYYELELVTVLLCFIAFAVGACIILIYATVRGISHQTLVKLKLN
ncbi:unnamed protein product, partial [Iphiclides podalirius]